MDVLKRLDQLIDINESLQTFEEVEQFIKYIKTHLRQTLGRLFIKVVFDKTDNGNGIVFIKFSSLPWKGTSNEQLAFSDLNFIISIEGFDASGKLSDDSIFNVEMTNFHAPQKQIRRLPKRKMYNLNDVGEYVKRYFTKESIQNIAKTCNEANEVIRYFDPDELYMEATSLGEDQLTFIYGFKGRDKGEVWTELGGRDVSHPFIMADKFIEEESFFDAVTFNDDEPLNYSDVVVDMQTYTEKTPSDYIYGRFFNNVLSLWEPGRNVLVDGDSVWLKHLGLLEGMMQALSMHHDIKWNDVRWSLSHDRDITTQEIVSGKIKEVDVGETKKGEQHILSPVDPRKKKMKIQPKTRKLPKGMTPAEYNNLVKQEEVKVEEEAPAPAATGTSSGVNGQPGTGPSGDEPAAGNERTEGDVAAKSYRVPGVARRNKLKPCKCGTKNCKCK
jgi:hypothetical protein